MTDPTIAPQLTGYAATAADLRLIADALDKLPTDIAAPYLMLSILPSAKAVEAVDAVTLAVLGKPGKTRKDSDGWRHIAEGRVGGAYVHIHALVPGPPDEREAELARLRAEVEQLRAQQSGLDYSREADDPTPVSGARVAMHTGAVTEAGLVDETERPAMAASGLTLAADKSRGPLAGTTPVVTYFSFGHGQTDPANGKKLLDHYVTVVAPTYEECREAMFASRFGRAWSFDYLAGRERTTEWVSRWAEHEVIVAPGVAEMDAERALTAAKMLLTDDPGPCWHGDIAPGRECSGSGPDCGPAF